MRVGQTRRRDAAEKPIVDALRKIGAHVTQVSGEGAPDLIVRYKRKVVCGEVKTGKGKRTDAQADSQWPIWRTVEDAMKAIGVA